MTVGMISAGLYAGIQMSSVTSKLDGSVVRQSATAAIETCRGPSLHHRRDYSGSLLATGIWLCSLDGKNARKNRAGKRLVIRGTGQG